MKKFFVAFGKQHEHLIGSMHVDHTKVVEVNADTVSDVETVADKVFGKQYAMITTKEQHIPSLFPGGTVATAAAVIIIAFWIFLYPIIAELNDN